MKFFLVDEDEVSGSQIDEVVRITGDMKRKHEVVQRKLPEVRSKWKEVTRKRKWTCNPKER
ncbi:hypothetical protein FLK61_31600 [Paenalkalicoccus suaedae]|uniref:Uncharacterized protein n=1 Tax=Paenalkalicoccus suaedae TaxID=2592382 RepID=A0A859FGA1_9BACI|nr:hypothetical protein FLK61_31600 [Paenalkalicoccus suaedae]